MDLKWNKHNNMRICWTCKTWNHQSFNYRPTKLNIQHSNTDPTHTPMSLPLSHTLMMWSESQWYVMRSGSSDWLKKQEVSTFHTHSNSHSTTNDQWEARTVSGWTNPNLSSWWAQQGLDNQYWADENSPISTVLGDKQSPFCQGIGLHNKMKCCLFWC